jgi:hypothetical protein
MHKQNEQHLSQFKEGKTTNLPVDRDRANANSSDILVVSSSSAIEEAAALSIACGICEATGRMGSGAKRKAYQLGKARRNQQPVALSRLHSATQPTSDGHANLQ